MQKVTVPEPVRCSAELIAAYGRISGKTDMKSLLADLHAYCNHRGTDFWALLPPQPEKTS